MDDEILKRRIDIDDVSIDTEDEVTRMFTGGTSELPYDEALAVHIMHRFNIDRDTIQSMPAFDEAFKTILSQQREE